MGSYIAQLPLTDTVLTSPSLWKNPVIRSPRPSVSIIGETRRFQSCDHVLIVFTFEFDEDSGIAIFPSLAALDEAPARGDAADKTYDDKKNDKAYENFRGKRCIGDTLCQSGGNSHKSASVFCPFPLASASAMPFDAHGPTALKPCRFAPGSPGEITDTPYSTIRIPAIRRYPDLTFGFGFLMNHCNKIDIIEGTERNRPFFVIPTSHHEHRTAGEHVLQHVIGVISRQSQLHRPIDIPTAAARFSQPCPFFLSDSSHASKFIAFRYSQHFRQP